MKVEMKILPVLILTTSICNLSLVNSFLQGAHSNTAIRKRPFYLNTKTPSVSYAKILFQTRRLYGHSQEDEESTTNDGENHEEEEIQYSSQQVENARKSFESMFAIPNDNQKSKSKHHYNTSSSSTISSMDGESDNPTTDSFLNNNDSNKDDEQLRETVTKIRDITKITSSVPVPPLTAVGRTRRLHEIKLISMLTQSDEAITDLWALWIAEKGPAAATLLLRSEQLMHVESYDEAEKILWTIIHQYGSNWAEPINRLATLKYMQGKYEESKQLCELVLQIKPWHFGALRGLVLICTASNDAAGARLWSERCCPDLNAMVRRTKWVALAIEAATDRLKVAASVGRESIDKQEEEFRSSRAHLQQLYMDNDVTSSDKSRHEQNHNNNDDVWQ